MSDKFASISEWLGLAGIVNSLYSSGGSGSSSTSPPSVRWIKTEHEVDGRKQIDYESEGTRRHPILSLTKYFDGSCRLDGYNPEVNEIPALHMVLGDTKGVLFIDGKDYSPAAQKRAQEFLLENRQNFFNLTRLHPNTNDSITRAYFLLSNYRLYT